MRFLIEEYETVDVDVLRANRDQIYTIELTLDGKACTGAECLLAEPNTCGIPVRNAIVMDVHVPFSDQEMERKACLQPFERFTGEGLVDCYACIKRVLGQAPTGSQRTARASTASCAPDTC